MGHYHSAKFGSDRIERISTKCCIAAAVVDVITYDNFFSDRLRDVDSVGGRKSGVPID